MSDSRPPDYSLWSNERKAGHQAKRRLPLWTALRWWLVAVGAAYVLRQLTL